MPGYSELPQMAPDELELKPKRRFGCGCGCLVMLIALVLAGVAGGIYVFRMDDARRYELLSKVKEYLRGPVLEEMKATFAPVVEQTPPIPPINESGDHGIIPEHIREKGDSASENQKSSEEVPASEETAEPEKKPEKPSSDDHVRPAFVQDLAGWVVSRYRSGSLGLSVQALNQRYGKSLTGLSGQGGGNARQAVYRYVLHPNVVRTLYDIYADSFLEAVAREARAPVRGRALSEAQLKGLYKALGGQSASLAAELEGVAGIPDIAGRMRRLQELDRQSRAADEAVLDARFELARVTDTQGSPREIEIARKKLLETSARASQSTQTARLAERSLIEDARKNGLKSASDETILYLARWVNRRLVDDAGSLDGIRASASILRDFSGRCASVASGELPGDEGKPQNAGR